MSGVFDRIAPGFRKYKIILGRSFRSAYVSFVMLYLRAFQFIFRHFLT